MIKHYAVVSGVQNEDGSFTYSLDNGLLPGVAMNLETGEWLTPSKVELAYGSDKPDVVFITKIIRNLLQNKDYIAE